MLLCVGERREEDHDELCLSCPQSPIASQSSRSRPLKDKKKKEERNQAIPKRQRLNSTRICYVRNDLIS